MKSQRETFSDETLADLLAAPGESASSADVQTLKSALASYRTETLQWAERRSAVQPSLTPAARRIRRWAGVPQWSLAAVAAVTIAAGVVHLVGSTADEPAPAGTVATMNVAPEPRSSPEQIAADNRLLNSIDDALSYHSDAPVAELGLKPSVRRADAEKAAEEAF